MPSKKIVYIISNIEYSLAFIWIAKSFAETNKRLQFIFLHPKVPRLQRELEEIGVKCQWVEFQGRKDFFKSSWRILRILKSIRPNVVHTHLFEANLIGLLISFLLRIPKRIYTRHHSTFNWEYYPHAIKRDRFCNFLATEIIAISKNVESVLVGREKVNPKKIRLIHHGFDLESFSGVNYIAVQKLKAKYKLNSSHPIIGVVSRFIKWKGIEYIISAFSKFLIDYPGAKLVLANANGPDKKYILTALKKLRQENYVLIEFETEIQNLYSCFDMFVHTPLNAEIEAFGQVYIESLASGVPSIFSLSGVASEFIENEINACVVGHENAEEIYCAMMKIMTNRDYRNTLIENGMVSVKQFGIENFIQKLKLLYDE